MNTKSYFLGLFLLVSFASNAQLKAKVKCDDFTVDILNGKVNDLKANFTLETIKDKFPCYTSAEREDTSSKCGEGLFFKDKDLLFYTGRDYIQIGKNLKGRYPYLLWELPATVFLEHSVIPK